MKIQNWIKRWRGWGQSLRALWQGWHQGGVIALMLLATPFAQAAFVNGGFESGDLSGWTVNSYERTSTLAQVPPRNVADLRLGVVPANGFTEILTGSNVAVPDAPTISYPRWGNYLVRVNNKGDKSTSRQASSIEQTVTMTAAEVDPVDNKIHVRFGMAPVLFNPTGHAPDDQPFFYIEVVNVNKNGSDKVLFSTFNYANQPGAPWQGSVGGYLWTDWSGFDIAPGPGLLDVGDTVRFIVYASNCYAGAKEHEARVYLDAVGAFMPGLTVAATGPSTTKPSENITYTYNYTNNSGLFAQDTKIRVALPITEDRKLTTYVSNDSTCTGPYSGIAPRQDYLECSVGDLNNGQSGSFHVTYTVPAGASTSGANAVLNNGDYSISASGVSAFLGPMVKTNILDAAAAVADLGITISNGGVAGYLPASPVIQTVTVTNLGSTAVTGASVTQTVAGVTGGSWTCSPAANCGAVSGTGDISSSTVNLLAGESVVYTYTAQAATAGSTVSTTVTVAVPSGVSDSNTSNNIAGLSTPVGASLHNVTVKADGAGAGHVLAVPAALVCGDASTACTTTGTTKAVAVGDEVRLTPVAHAGSIFTGWTGCTSTSGNVCVITMGAADVTAKATFAKAYVVTPTVTGTGTVTPSGSTQVAAGANQVLTLSPGSGMVTLVEVPSTGACKGNTLNTGVSPATLTVGPVDANCAVTVKFSPSGTPVSMAAATAGMTPTLLPSSTCTGTFSASAPYTFTPTGGPVGCTAALAFVAPSTTSIPSLSQWGMWVLSVLIGLTAMGLGRRRGFL